MMIKYGLIAVVALAGCKTVKETDIVRPPMAYLVRMHATGPNQVSCDYSYDKGIMSYNFDGTSCPPKHAVEY